MAEFKRFTIIKRAAFMLGIDCSISGIEFGFIFWIFAINFKP